MVAASQSEEQNGRDRAGLRFGFGFCFHPLLRPRGVPTARNRRRGAPMGDSLGSCGSTLWYEELKQEDRLNRAYVLLRRTRSSQSGTPPFKAELVHTNTRGMLRRLKYRRSSHPATLLTSRRDIQVELWLRTHSPRDSEQFGFLC
eukprot:scaffold336_cov250-Pinguiococcus_pyrenoidosus.AAC.43